eukprot:15262088-Heterocapsa_arctica.AAC.1
MEKEMGATADGASRVERTARRRSDADAEGRWKWLKPADERTEADAGTAPPAQDEESEGGPETAAAARQDETMQGAATSSSVARPRENGGASSARPREGEDEDEQKKRARLQRLEEDIERRGDSSGRVILSRASVSEVRLLGTCRPRNRRTRRGSRAYARGEVPLRRSRGKVSFNRPSRLPCAPGGAGAGGKSRSVGHLPHRGRTVDEHGQRRRDAIRLLRSSNPKVLIGGRATHAQVYPERRCGTICTGTKEQQLDDEKNRRMSSDHGRVRADVERVTQKAARSGGMED